MGLFEHARPDEGQPEEIVRWHCVFHGRVQGVGFRYQSMLLADRLELTGWVRNRADGAVEAELQGTRSRADRFLKEIRAARWIHVTRLELDDRPLCKNETRFRVAY